MDAEGDGGRAGAAVSPVVSSVRRKSAHSSSLVRVSLLWVMPLLRLRLLSPVRHGLAAVALVRSALIRT